jgi:Uma2 family endonuclease
MDDPYSTELIDGIAVPKPPMTPFRGRIRGGVGMQFDAGWCPLGGQGLSSHVPGYEPTVDAAVTTEERIADNANPFPADRVELVVDILPVAGDPLRAKKQVWYARSGIPLYLLIDSNDGVCELHSEPHGGAYRTTRTNEFGEPVPLPDPFGFPLDTSSFRLYPPR